MSALVWHSFRDAGLAQPGYEVSPYLVDPNRVGGELLRFEASYREIWNTLHELRFRRSRPRHIAGLRISHGEIHEHPVVVVARDRTLAFRQRSLI